MTTEHDPDGTMGWRTVRGVPTRTHPIVAESMREVLDKAEKERSGVISEVVTRLPLYRDPLIDAATAYSDFRIDDLVNRVQPVSLYLVVPFESRDRLKPLTRLMINQIRAPPDGHAGLQEWPPGLAAPPSAIADAG